jgi:hypothetical protein
MAADLGFGVLGFRVLGFRGVFGALRIPDLSGLSVALAKYQ